MIGTIWSDGRPRRRRARLGTEIAFPPFPPFPRLRRSPPPKTAIPPEPPDVGPPPFFPLEMAISPIEGGGGPEPKGPKGRRFPEARTPTREKGGPGTAGPGPAPRARRRRSLAWIFKGRPTRSGRF